MYWNLIDYLKSESSVRWQGLESKDDVVNKKIIEDMEWRISQLKTLRCIFTDYHVYRNKVLSELHKTLKNWHIRFGCQKSSDTFDKYIEDEILNKSIFQSHKELYYS